MSPFEKTVGFIGSGNMARAIIRGMITTGLVAPGQVWISDANPDQVVKLAAETGVNAVESNTHLAQQSDILILATKPHHVVGVMQEIQNVLVPERHLVISICAGVRTPTIENSATAGVRVIRVMPNTPALIGCGSAAISGGKHASSDDLKVASQIFDSVGVSVVVDEDKLDAVTGVSGSGPAYVFRFMEALLAAAEQQGLTREEAHVLVPQMVLGAARMAVEGERSLEDLRQAVTTPGGTTAAGLRVLEENNFMELIDRCVTAATARSRELAQDS